MLRLDRHIESLLTKYDCVILPGFGGFVAHHVSARIDGNNGVMLPPTTTVGFNPQLTINDSLLVQSYVETYDYSFPEALHIVAEEIRQMESVLQQKGHYELPSVGELSLSNSGKYVFEPNPSGILIPEFYALPSIEIADDECFISSVEAKENRRLSYSGGEDDDKDDKVIKISVRTLRRVAAIFIAILLLASIPFISRNTNTNELLSSIGFSSIDNLMPKMAVATDKHMTVAYEQEQVGAPGGSCKREQSSLLKLPSAAETESDQKQNAEEAVVSEPTQIYTVVLAARISLKNATLFVEKLHNEGIISARVVGEGKSRKVVCGNFNSEDEAQQERKVLASDKGFADAWVLKIKES